MSDTYGFVSNKNKVVDGKLTIPAPIKNIGYEAYSDRQDIRELELADSVTTIADKAFNFCMKLKKVTWSPNLEKIGDEAFSHTEIESFDAGKIKKINYKAFTNCLSLKKVAGDDVTEIDAEAFIKCTSLKDIKFDNLEKIGENAFTACRSLEKIDFPKVKEVDECAFICSGVKEILLPRVEKLGNSAFAACEDLESVTLSSNISEISQSLFYKDYKLKSVNLDSKKILEIHNGAFEDCVSLTHLEPMVNLRVIGDKAFQRSSIKDFYIPNTVDVIGSRAFNECPRLKKLVIPDKEMFIGERAFQFKYISKEGDKFVLYDNASDLSVEHILNPKYIELKLQTKTNDTVKLSSELQVRFSNLIVANWEFRDRLVHDLESKPIALLYEMLYENLSHADFKQFLKTANMSYYRKMTKLFEIDTEITIKEINKFLYNLGAFESPKTIKRISKHNKEIEEKVDYAQKVTEYYRLLKRQRLFDYYNPSWTFRNMKVRPFNQELTDFILDQDNLKALLHEDEIHNDFFAKCFNEFEIVQKTHTTNRGNIRHLKPTVEKFIDYYRQNKFAGVTNETKDLAKVIAKYYSEQEAFDRAKRVFIERKEKREGHNILWQDLDEGILKSEPDLYNSVVDDIFNKVDKRIKELKTKITRFNVDTLDIMSDMANDKYYFEWLDKDSLENYILGKLCDCCAHVTGVGVGIMRASIVDSDTQNLVIRNKDGEIVAKATLNINRMGGYGVINNVEVQNNITGVDKDIIFAKFQMGVESFAKMYNKTFKYHPIHKINVGMSNNDLEQQIRALDKHEMYLKKAMDYSKYSLDHVAYEGDSGKEQYIVWEMEGNDEEKGV